MLTATSAGGAAGDFPRQSLNAKSPAPIVQTPNGTTERGSGNYNIDVVCARNYVPTGSHLWRQHGGIDRARFGLILCLPRSAVDRAHSTQHTRFQDKKAGHETRTAVPQTPNTSYTHTPVYTVIARLTVLGPRRPEDVARLTVLEAVQPNRLSMSPTYHRDWWLITGCENTSHQQRRK